MLDVHLPSVEDVKKLPPQWWAAIAGAGAAGATIFDEHRVIGGVGAAALMLFFALRVNTPCCAGCAGGQGGCADGARNTPTAPATSSTAPMVARYGGLDEGGTTDAYASEDLAASLRGAPLQVNGNIVAGGGCS